MFFLVCFFFLFLYVMIVLLCFLLELLSARSVCYKKKAKNKESRLSIIIIIIIKSMEEIDLLCYEDLSDYEFDEVDLLMCVDEISALLELDELNLAESKRKKRTREDVSISSAPKKPRTIGTLFDYTKNFKIEEMTARQLRKILLDYRGSGVIKNLHTKTKAQLVELANDAVDEIQGRMSLDFGPPTS